MYFRGKNILTSQSHNFDKLNKINERTNKWAKQRHHSLSLCCLFHFCCRMGFLLFALWACNFHFSSTSLSVDFSYSFALRVSSAMGKCAFGSQVKSIKYHTLLSLTKQRAINSARWRLHRHNKQHKRIYLFFFFFMAPLLWQPDYHLLTLWRKNCFAKIFAFWYEFSLCFFVLCRQSLCERQMEFARDLVISHFSGSFLNNVLVNDQTDGMIFFSVKVRCH